MHLKDLGQLVAGEIQKAGGIAKEFDTIAVNNGSAMGPSGMLYRLPSRELIVDAVEYSPRPIAPTRRSASPTATKSPRHADARPAP